MIQKKQPSAIQIKKEQIVSFIIILAPESRSSTIASKPVLLYVDRDAGHGAGKPLDARIREAVDQWSFLMWQTGACN